MRPTVTICGSYHKDITSLKRIFRELETVGFRILSPLTLDFVEPKNTVVKGLNETDFTASELEKFHLRAVSEATIIWLHAPDGYVGVSTAYELGYAFSKGKKIFCNTKPTEELFAENVNIVRSAFEALEFASYSFDDV